MLTENKLAGELETAFTIPLDAGVEPRTAEQQVQRIADAIEAYLADAKVSLTGSGVSFPSWGDFIDSFSFTGTATGTAAALMGALLTGMAPFTGDIDGLPVAPGTTIVSEVMDPLSFVPTTEVVAFSNIFTNTDGTVAQKAEQLASVIHGFVSGFKFTVTQMVPGTPPVPTPITGIPIL